MTFDLDAARHELWRQLNGYVCHLPEEDADWGYYIDVILRAATTGKSSPLVDEARALYPDYWERFGLPPGNAVELHADPPPG